MEERTTLAIRLPLTMKSDLSTLARATGRTRNALVEEALRRFIEVEKWQLADIEQAVRDADAGDFATDEEMAAVWTRYHAAPGERAS